MVRAVCHETLFGTDVVTVRVGPKSNLHLLQDGVEGVTGAQFVDGEVECIKAVRKQVGAGADWIKVASILHSRSGMMTDI